MRRRHHYDPIHVFLNGGGDVSDSIPLMEEL